MVSDAHSLEPAAEPGDQKTGKAGLHSLRLHPTMHLFQGIGIALTILPETSPAP